MTTEELEERKHLQAVFQKNGYPEEVIRRGLQRATGIHTPPEKTEEEHHSAYYVTSEDCQRDWQEFVHGKERDRCSGIWQPCEQYSPM